MGTASRAAVVRHYGHFRRPDGFRFSQRSPAGAWMLAAPTIHATARLPRNTPQMHRNLAEDGISRFVTQALAVRVLFRATPTATRDLGLYGLI
jgi:hypothetical protein